LILHFVNEELVDKGNVNSKSSLSIGGKMSEKGADKAGVVLAYCLGGAAILVALAAFVYAIRWW